MLSAGLESRLKYFSDTYMDFSPLYESWKINKRTLEKLMQVTIGAFPHYSLHDATHCKSVLNTIEMLLGNERINELSPTDIWLLLNSIYAHDIGMLSISNLNKLWSADSFQQFMQNCKNGSLGDEFKQHALNLFYIEKKESFSKWSLNIHLSAIFLLAEYHRKNHPQRSAESISNYTNIDLSVNNLIPHRLISWISKIVQSHGEEFQYILDLDYEDNGFCRDYIHPRFLSSLLCLGDALDMDNSRFHPFSSLIIGEIPESSDVHRKKHEAIRQLRITPQCIEITADCGKAENYHATYRVLREWCDMLKQEVENISLYWNELIPKGLSGFAPTLKEIKYYVEEEQINPALARLKFNISQKRAFEIIQGANIYDNKYDFLRELIQNAMDASKIQFWKDIQDRCFHEDEVTFYSQKLTATSFQPYHVRNMNVLERYKINVLFEALEGDLFRISVQDNGTGFTEESLQEMSQAGQSYSSYARKKLIENMPVWLRPTGNFGIGLQSLFLVCEQFMCKTRSRESGISYDIIFHSQNNGGYLDVIKTKECNAYGSTFILECKNDILFSPLNYTDDLNQTAFNIYNEFNYFTDKALNNASAQIGTVHAYSYITHQMSDTFMPVALSINNGPHQKHSGRNKIYESIASCKAKGTLYDNDYDVYFDTEKLACTIWCRSNNYYASIKPGDHSGQVYYKDIHVSKSPIHTRYGLYQNISLFGYQANEILELNRSKLLEKGNSAIEDICKNTFSLWKRAFFDHFDSAINALKKNANSDNDPNISHTWYVSLLAVYFSNCSDRLDKLKNMLECNIDYTLNVYKLGQQLYSLSQISVKNLFTEIIANDCFQFCVSDHSSLPYDNSRIKNLNSIVSQINKYQIIFSLSGFNGYLEDWYDSEAYIVGDRVHLTVKIKEVPKSTKCNFKEYLRILTKHLDMDIYDSHVILTHCVFPYETISISRTKIVEAPREFWLSVNQSYVSLKSSYMILPLNSKNLIDIKSQKYTKEHLLAELTSKEEYDGIVQFTFDNQYEDNKHDKSEIDTEYKKLIADIYDSLCPNK